MFSEFVCDARSKVQGPKSRVLVGSPLPCSSMIPAPTIPTDGHASTSMPVFGYPCTSLMNSSHHLPYFFSYSGQLCGGHGRSDSLGSFAGIDVAMRVTTGILIPSFHDQCCAKVLACFACQRSAKSCPKLFLWQRACTKLSPSALLPKQSSQTMWVLRRFLLPFCIAVPSI